MEGIGQQGQPSTNGEEPERDGDDALLSLLRGNPLDQEAHGKERLPHKPDRQPEMLVAHRPLGSADNTRLLHPAASTTLNAPPVPMPPPTRRLPGPPGPS